MRGEGRKEVTEERRDGWKEDWTDGNGGLRDRGTEGCRDDFTPYLPPSGSLPLPMPPSCKRKRPSLRPMQKSRESETGGEREGARGSEGEGGGEGGREGGRERNIVRWKRGALNSGSPIRAFGSLYRATRMGLAASPSALARP